MPMKKIVIKLSSNSSMCIIFYIIDKAQKTEMEKREKERKDRTKVSISLILLYQFFIWLNLAQACMLHKYILEILISFKKDTSLLMFQSVKEKILSCNQNFKMYFFMLIRIWLSFLDRVCDWNKENKFRFWTRQVIFFFN